MTPTGVAALICLAIAFAAFIGVVIVYWPRQSPLDETVERRFQASPAHTRRSGR